MSHRTSSAKNVTDANARSQASGEEAREAARTEWMRMRGMRKVGKGSKVMTRCACGALSRCCNLG